ncbi:unnamed protein product, partial [Thlaspi arvense]
MINYKSFSKMILFIFGNLIVCILKCLRNDAILSEHKQSWRTHNICVEDDTFKRPKFTASTNFHKHACTKLDGQACSFSVAKISKSTRFYPYFKDYIEAIHDTHITAMVKSPEKACYHNRKGVILQNILAAYNFDLEFIYVISGREDSVHDSKVLQDALTRRTNRQPVLESNNNQYHILCVLMFQENII